MDDDEIRSALRAIGNSLHSLADYQGRAEVERLLDRIRDDPKRLEPHGRKVYSQNDEDGIIEEICRRLGIETGTFVEIGVEHGLESNSLYLLHKGWRGAWVEGDSKHGKAIRSRFESLLHSGRLVLAQAVVTAENVNRLLEDPRLGLRQLDFLSIDIDGNDIHLLRALQRDPKIICIEYNAKWPPSIRKVPVYDPARRWTGTDYMGASLAALNDVASDKGYRLVATNITGSNAFFVRNDLAQAHFPDDASPEALYNPPRYWLRFALEMGHPADFGPYEDLVDGPP